MISSSSFRLFSLCKRVLFHSSNSKTSNIDFIENKGLPKVVLNRPKALNSLNTEMVYDLSNLIPTIEKYPAFWMEGAGGKAFCAGGDVVSLFAEGAGVDVREKFFRDEFGVDYRLATCKSLQIANWDGIVMGGGVGISHFAPFRIATENTLFAMPEAKIGFFTDVGTGATLANLRNNIGMYLGLTSGRLKGEDVYNSGLANYFVTRDSIPNIYNEISSAIPSSTNVAQTIQSILQKYHKGQKNKKISNEDEIKEIFGAPTVTEIYQRAQNSQTEFGKNTVKLLEGVSPLSIHAVHKLVKESHNLGWKEIFVRDFILAQNFIVNDNFLNGVRSLLITKDNNPQWTHKSINEVTKEQVNELFILKSGNKGLQI